jgi:hypothetical protein
MALQRRQFLRLVAGAAALPVVSCFAWALSQCSERNVRKLLLVIAIAATLASITPAMAQAPSLAGKNVTMIIASGTGGGYDLWGRLVARHLGKHLPGKPTVVAQNMPAAGGIVAANHIYNVAPKDGTAMGLITGGAVLGPITGAAGARFDPTRITWLGSPTQETQICMAYNSPQVKVKTLKDLYEQELIVGATGPGGPTYIYPKALAALLGMKFKVIAGFQAAPPRVPRHGAWRSRRYMRNFRQRVWKPARLARGQEGYDAVPERRRSEPPT